MGMGKEGDEFELNLELSIGRGYGKTEDSKGKIAEICQENADCGISRFNFYSATENNACESMDLQRRKEIKAMRRQEARRRREEKIKRARIVERECFSCINGVRDDLRLCLFTNQKAGSDGLYPKVQQCSGPRNGNLFVDCDSEHSNGINDRRNGNQSSGQCSSAVSDYQSKSYRGGSSSDTDSHSTRQPLHHPTTSTTALVSHGSSSQAEACQVLAGPKIPPSTSTPLPKPDLSRDQTNNASSTSENLSRETSGGLNQKPSNINAAASVPRMPCVSATGNGPNGRTIRGFLYKYTKMEVSIVCVCHRRSFSPAGFVEHAGGVDISHPLKHITIVPTALVG